MKIKSIFTVIFVLLFWGCTFSQYQKISVLVYTSPDVYHNPSVPAAVTSLKEMAAKNFMDLDWTQLESNFNDSVLSNYSAVVFLHANDNKLNNEQLQSLQRFIQSGKGFVGIHAASVRGSEWFRKLVGRTFLRHPEKQTAVMQVTDESFPATFHLPGKWMWTDEWYEFGEALTENQHVVLTVDENTYFTEVGMGKFHPISWYQEYDGGRSFFTALGHMQEAYADKFFLDHILGGIYWAATGKGVSK
ncbi:ThuA domain-containing protein [Sunxiuqinia sp. A32]|uniref:ThuA domain-containing protein n=1 Tax=Sunxiuqinia sp. A32 TaxID=3461496 RepID=UPI004045596A